MHTPFYPSCHIPLHHPPHPIAHSSSIVLYNKILCILKIKQNCYFQIKQTKILVSCYPSTIFDYLRLLLYLSCTAKKTSRGQRLCQDCLKESMLHIDHITQISLKSHLMKRR